MATSGHVNTNTTYESYFWVKWEQSGNQDIANNRTLINWYCGVYCGHAFYSNAIKMSAVTINGTPVYGGGTYSNYSKGNHTIASGSMWIGHTTDGTKKFSISAFTGWLYSGYDYSAPATEFTLEKIPRYANFTTYDISNITENGFTVKWGCDASCDAICYTLDNGVNWIYPTGNNYPYFTVGGLSANTSYTIQLSVKRTDSQLWSYSDNRTVTTYNYPHCTSSPNFTIGDALTLDFYNPLGRNITVTGYSRGGNEIFGGSTNGTRLVGFNDVGSVERQYKSIPNSQSGTYGVIVSYENVSMTRDAGNVYQIRGNEIPTINALGYEEGNASVFAITNNKKHIVQNKSELVVDFPPATPNFYAGGIAKYKVECNGKSAEGTDGHYSLGAIDSSNDVDLTLTATDSRGLSATKTIKVTMIAYSEPYAMVTLERLNNYEDETYLTVDASMSSVEGKNTMNIEYSYKLSTEDYSPFVAIPNRETQTFNLDKNNIFVFNVVVTDVFGGKFDREYILYKGVFPLFIDTQKNAVGINEFPADGEAIRVAGGIAHFEDGVKINNNLLADYPIERGTSGIWTYKKWNSGDVDLWGISTLDNFGDTRHIYKWEILPFALVDNPIVDMTIKSAESNAYTQGAMVSYSYGVGELSIKLVMIKDAGGLTSGNTASVCVHIKGRWK